MSSTLLTFQQEVADRLLADPFFANIPVVTEILKDISGTINTAVANCGLAVLVATPAAGKPFPNVSTPFWEDIDVTVQTHELPAMNNGVNSSIRSLEVCEKICALLNPPWVPVTYSRALLPRSPTIRLVPNKTFLVYHCRYSASGGVVYTPSQVATPVVSTSPTPVVAPVSSVPVTVTISCATSGAAIFYTLDGKYPAPRNGTFYTAPFVISSAATLRTRAWLAGYNASEEIKVSYS